MKKLLFGLIVSLVCLWPAAVSAHVLKTDGSIGAVMHMDPDDDPVAGQDTTFYFDIKDKSSSFDLAKCDCTFTVKQGDNLLTSQEVSGSGSSAVAAYAFPGTGVYQIGLSGKPAAGGGFGSFALVYSVRVDRTNTSAAGSPSSASGSNKIIVGVGVLVVVAFGLVLGLSLRKQQGKQ